MPYACTRGSPIILLLNHPGMAQIFGLVRTLSSRSGRANGQGSLTKRKHFGAFDDTVGRLPANDWEFAFFPLFHGRHSQNESKVCSANQSGFVTVEKPAVEDDAARKPLASQKNSGEGTHQPRWKMSANVEGPFLLHFSESLREKGAICF